MSGPVARVAARGSRARSRSTTLRSGADTPAVGAWLAARLRDPLYRNGYALIASSALTSALGLLYWLIAARLYSATAVGVGAALIAASTLLANLAQLNLKGALNRFLPRAGRGTARFVTRAYAVALAASAVASVAFLAGLGVWSPDLAFLVDRPALGVWFVATTMVWTIFVLQDNVLAGIRQAGWVPAENLVYAVAKIVLLVAAVGVAPTLGVFAAWTAPLLALVVPLNLLLYRRLIPRHVRAEGHREQTVATWRVAHYVAADYTAYLISAATIGALPLIVLAALGPEANAYYFVSWSVAYALYLVASGMGVSMITEASLDPAGLEAHARRAMAETARIVVPAVALIVAGAPLLLEAMGGDYAGESTTLLRLLALSALPWIVVVTYTNVARVRRQMRAVVVANAALSVLVLAIGLPLLGVIGIDGVGLGWLAGQSAVAAAIGVAHRWPRAVEQAREVALRTLSRTRTAAVNQLRRWRSEDSLRAVLADLRRAPERREWIVQRHLPTLNDVAVATVGPPRGQPAALVKRAMSRPAARALGVERTTMELLHARPEAEGWGRLVPGVIASGEAGGRSYLVESFVAGPAGERLLVDASGHRRLLRAAEMAILPLHERTRSVVRVGDELLADWVEAPAARVLGVVAGHSGLARGREGLRRLAGELRDELDGRCLLASRIHGDLCPQNIVMRPDGSGVAGIIDWEQSRDRSLVQIDLMHLLVTARMAVDRRELGAVVADMLDNPGWRPSERSLARALEQRDPSLAGSTRTLLLLTWLHHVAANVGKSGRYAASRTWVRRNVDPVLAVLLRTPQPAGIPAAPVPAPVRRPARPGIRSRARAAAAAIGGARLEVAAAIAAVGAAAGLWLFALGQVDVGAMGDLGLVSVLPVTFVAALALLCGSFAWVVQRTSPRRSLLALHVLSLIAFLHATPVLLYETLRYSWAWKHLGIVDYIQRHGGVATDSAYLDVYHNWPGFFGLDALLVELGGFAGTMALATWSPVVFNVLNLGALLFLFSGLTRDRRIVWVGAFLFFVSSWVGQDYFSPQAFAFLCYLLVLGVVVRWLGSGRGEDAGDAAAAIPRSAAIGLVALLSAAVAVSHALTAVMLCVSLVALVAFRVCGAPSVVLVAVGVTVAWDLGFATDFVTQNIASVVERISVPWATTGASLEDASVLSDGQQLVSTIVRGLVLAVAALAAVGAIRALRARKLALAPVLLALAPLSLFLSGDYDGEILFRIYLFAVPFLAFLGANALVAPAAGERSPAARQRRFRGPAVATAVVTSLLLAGFVFAYYGKDNQYRFTQAEVDAATYVYANAPAGTQIIQGTNNYPGQFERYERFTYLTMADEPPVTHAALLARPVSVVSEWMEEGPAGGRSLLIITRSQKAEVDELGVLPPGTLEHVERALLRSDRFRTVLRNGDAVVFAPAATTRTAVR